MLPGHTGTGGFPLLIVLGSFFHYTSFIFLFQSAIFAFFILLLPKTIPLLLLVSEPSVAFDKHYCLFRFSKNTDKTSDKNCGKASFIPGFRPPLCCMQLSNRLGNKLQVSVVTNNFEVLKKNLFFECKFSKFNRIYNRTMV